MRRDHPAASPMVCGQQAIDRIDPLADATWSHFINGFPHATFFHTAEWARVLCDTYGFKPEYFVARDAAGSPRALVPFMEVDSWLTGRRGLSLPFTDACAPLSANRESACGAIDAVTSHAQQRHWKFWELRGGVDELRIPTSVAFHGHRLALEHNSERLFGGFLSSTRWAIRKAQHAGVDVIIANDADSMAVFHALVCKTRKRQGLPPQPFKFYANLHRHALARGHGCIVLARLGATPVAGAIFLHFRKTALFKFGASDAAFHSACPNNLVIWRAIEWHAQNGFETMDFGRTSLANEGLRHYKLGWGTTESTISYARFDCRRSAYVTTKDLSHGWHNRLFHLLPSAVARVLGAVAYKHIA